MSLKDRINDDLKQSLLAGDKPTAEVLRGFKAAILNEEVAAGSRESGLDDDLIEKLIAREIKKRNESAEVYKQAGRQELVEAELFEAGVLSKYLPEQTSEEDIRNVVLEILGSMSEVGPAAMGQVIGQVKAKFGNSADGATVARIVKQEIDKK